MSKFKQFAISGLVAGAFLATVAIVGGFVQSNKPLVAQSARDCDSNAVVYCGGMTVNETVDNYNKNTTGDLPAIYNAMGISSAAVNSLKTQAALGQVHKDGTVWLDGKQIADNAMTAGRQYMAGSTALAGTSIYTRTPSVSFAASSIDAFIGFENGQPAWAILSACGNPVKWDKPNVTVDKKVAKADQSGWTEDATYTNNTETTYLITVKNTGQAADTNVTVFDQLPANQTYVAGSTQINTAASIDGITTAGLNLGTLAAGQTTYITFRAKISVPAGKCGVTEMVNIVRQDSDKGGAHQDTATTRTNVNCITVSCDAMTGPVTLTLGESGVYSLTATAINTTISSFVFSVDGQVVQDGMSGSYTYKPATAGKHTVSGVVRFADGSVATGKGKCQKELTVADKPVVKTVKCESLTGPSIVNEGQSATFVANVSDASLVESYTFDIDGKKGGVSTSNQTTITLAPGAHTVKVVITPKAGVTDGGSANCVKTYTVKENPKPVYSCDALTVNPSAIKVGGSVNATASYTAKDGAAFKSATFNFGEGAPVVVTNASALNASHTYATAGTYNLTVDLEFTVNGQTISAKGAGNCVKQVTVTPNEQPKVVTKCDALTASKNALLVNETTTLTAAATALNTTVSEVIFKVNGQVVQSGSTKLTYDFKPTAKGDYKVTVSVKFANGDVKGDDAACSKTITVTEKEQPVTPVYSCDAFTASPTAAKVGDKVKVTIKYTATNGATFKKAVIDYGEDKVTVTTGTNNTVVAEYAYKAAKEYAIKAVLTFTVDGKEVEVAGAQCAGKVTITTTPPPTTVIPDTGAGNVFGAFAGVTAAGAFMHNVLARRALRR